MSKLKKLNSAVKKASDKKTAKKELNKLVSGVIRNKHIYYSSITSYDKVKFSFDKVTGDLEFFVNFDLTTKFMIKGRKTTNLKVRFKYVPINVNKKKQYAHECFAQTGYNKTTGKNNAEVSPYVIGVINKACKHYLDNYRKLNNDSDKIMLSVTGSIDKETGKKKKVKTEVKIKGKKSANGKVKNSAKAKGKKPVKRNVSKKKK